MSYLYYYDKPEDGVPVLFKVNATTDEEAKDKIANYVLWSVENEVKFEMGEITSKFLIGWRKWCIFLMQYTSTQ